MKRLLREDEMSETRGGEAISLAAVIAVMAVALIGVIVYRFFMSNKGSLVLPGGYTFNWGK